jgi:predicted PurR-regulated permease PerM
VVALYVTTGLVLWGMGALFVPKIYAELSTIAKDGSKLFALVDEAHIAGTAGHLGEWLEDHNLPVHIVSADDDLPGRHVHASPVLTIDVVDMTRTALREASTWFKHEASEIVGQAQVVVGGVLRGVFATFLVLMLTAFITADSERIVTFVFSITPVSDRTRLHGLLERIDHGLSGVVRGQLTICLINGVLTFIGLWLLHVQFAFLLAIVASVLSLVPIFGSIMSSVPIVVVALADGFSTALLSVGWIVGIHLLEANLLNPKIMGDAAKMHPVLVVLALIVGEHYYGMVGALLAVPLASILVTIYKTARARAMVLDAEVVAAENAPARVERRAGQRVWRERGE